MNTQQIIKLSITDYADNNMALITWAQKYPEKSLSLIKLLNELKVGKSWAQIFNKSNIKKELQNISQELSIILQTQDKNIFPCPSLVFSVFKMLKPENIKVVILGQDPYHAPKQAMGLSFSVPHGVAIPPSLRNIYNNLLKNKLIDTMPTHGNLSSWVVQGCFLLNTALTVIQANPNSHEHIWAKLTDMLIQELSASDNNIVFMLWGGNALKKLSLIDTKKHHVLVSSHPSTYSCNNKLNVYNSFNDSNHFQEANDYLIKNNKSPIDWNIK